MGSFNRRQFLSQAGLTAGLTAGLAGLPRWNGLCPGNDDLQFEFDHQWARLPDRYTWQTTHNVAVDSQGQVYVIHEGRRDQPDHPSIFVFDTEGRFVRAFGEEFQGGGHGLEVRREGSDEFLYVSAYLGLNCIAKLTTGGELIWKQYAPLEAGVYAPDEVQNARQRAPSVWGRDRFMPTNFGFLPDGRILVADGYGSWLIHLYDRDGNWQSCFGGPGEGPGRFDTPHGLWVDASGDSPRVIVADRARHQLQWLTPEGEHLRTQTGFGLPANIDLQGDRMLVPELLGRISLLDRDGQRVLRAGDDRQRIEADTEFRIRRDPATWNEGKFVHPHDACFDLEGNILVAEWMAGGRLSKLKAIA